MSLSIHRQILSVITIISMLVMVMTASVGFLRAASAPNILTYQGRVLDANGVPLSGSSLSMKFFLYTAASGGTCVWSNSSGTCDGNTPGSTTARTVTLTNGLFTENLGDTSLASPYAAIADTTFADNGTIYIEVVIAGETLSPRRMLTAAPYALNADTIDGLDSTELSGLLENGTNGIFEDDAAVIVGADAAFSYGSGGIGDLRVADEFETVGDGYIGGDFVIGTSTSSTETIANVSFALTGDDLYVADDVGIEGDVFIDGNFYLDGGAVIGNGTSTVSITSSDWTIGTTGNMTGIGSISVDGSLTFNSVLTDITSSAADPITIMVGSADPGSNTTGGLLTLRGGSGDGAFNGGAVSITGGASGNGATGNGGALIFIGGTAISSNGNGGAASFQGGTGTGTGSGGSVTVRGGSGAVGGTGTAGALTLDAGITNGGTSAAINIGISNASAINIGTNLLTDVAGENTIGSTSFEWDGLYIGDDGAGIQFGSTQDITIIWDDIASALELDGGLVAIGTDTGGTIATGDGDLLVEDALEVLGQTRLNRVNISTEFSTFSVTGANGTEIISGRDAADSIYLTTAAGTSETIRLRSQLGTGAGSITLLSEAGGITLNASGTTAITNATTIGGTLVVTGAASFDGGANPVNAGVEALGTTALEWDGLYLGDDGVGITFGADQDVLLSYVSGSTDLNLALTDGNTFAIDGDGTPTATLLNIGSGDTFPAATTSDAVNIDFTAGAGDGADVYSALKLTVVSGNHAATTDQTIGLNIADLTSADAEGIESALMIGSGWDYQIKFTDSTSFFQITEGGYLAVNDPTGNTLFAITDAGDAGFATISGGLTFGLQTAVTLTAGATTFDATKKSSIRLSGDVATNTLTNFTGGDLNGQILIIEHLDGRVTYDCTASSLNCGSADFTPAIGDVSTWNYDGSWNLLAFMDDSDNHGTGNGFDIAEWYPATEDLIAGSVVVASTTDPIYVSASSNGYQKGLMGVVTTQPGIILGDAGQSTFATRVALAGRVPVNVTNENGSIQTGDYLTSSATKPGFAMKSTGPGPVIGMAMENFDALSGQIVIHIQNGWYMGDVISSDGSSTILTDKVVVAPLGTANSSQTSFDSYGFALRGSVWNSGQSQVLEMIQQVAVTDANNYRLSIRNTTDSEVAYITNTGTMQIAGDMVVSGKIYPSDRGTAQTNKFIYYDGSDGAGGDFMRTNAKGWSTGSYDFAEMFPSTDSLLPGEVVVLAGQGENVKRSMSANAKEIVGIVSTRPGFLAGENKIGSHPIALAGRVPTRTTTENGEIKVGDALTSSSKPGYAMKATKSGIIVGYALEPLVSGEKSILVYVNTGYWEGGSVVSAPGTNNQASGFGSGVNANYAALNMTGNIYVTGHEILSVGRIAGISDVWSIEQDGTIKTEALLKTVIRSYTDEKVETIAMTSPEALITLTGTAKLSDGQVEVRFEDFAPSFNDVIASDAPIRVVVTPSGPVSLYVSEKDNNHFIVKQFAGDLMFVEFDWMVTAYRKGYEPKPLQVVPTDVNGSTQQTPVAELQMNTQDNLQNRDPEVIIDPASPASPDENLIDSISDDEGGTQAEKPSGDLIEPAPIANEVAPSAELSSVQEASNE